MLTEKSAPEIWRRANEALKDPSMSAQGLIAKSNVSVICTTDDPIDDLRYHKHLKEEGKLDCRVLPAFRPDKALGIEKADFSAYIARLEEACLTDIKSLDEMLKALSSRMDFFGSLGCKLSDHAFEYLPFIPCHADEAAAIFGKGLIGSTLTAYEVDKYKTFVMLYLAKEYARRGWAMQLHIGALRNNNGPMFRQLGPDTGFDAMADHPLANNLGALLNALEQEGKLPKTILYTLNPKDNNVIASMAGCFQQAGIASKVQFGAAWWHADHKQGIEQQMRDLANIGMLSTFVGMLTDSRSFLSYTRHEYFRRILCNMLGHWVEDGECPNDPSILEPMVRGICYENALKYFDF